MQAAFAAFFMEKCIGLVSNVHFVKYDLYNYFPF